MKNKSRIIVVSICFISIIILLLFVQIMDEENRNSSLLVTDKLIRFHVLANSDSIEDQQIKRSVRDCVIEFLNSKMNRVRDINQATNIIKENIDEITITANDRIKKFGKSYTAKTLFENHEFPVKLYGDLVLPEGNYNAVRIVIGNGQGANWWCVLFPPLCFVDISHSVVSQSTKNEIIEAMDDVNKNSKNKKKNIPIKVKIKLIEILNDKNNKFSGEMKKFIKNLL